MSENPLPITAQKPPKSLYDASMAEIGAKHFFAGFMQGLGGLLVTVISWVLIYILVINIVLPQVSGMLTQAENLIKGLEKIQSQNADLMTPKSGSNGSPTLQIPPGLVEQIQQQMQPKAQ